jgi:hypothetical protein
MMVLDNHPKMFSGAAISALPIGPESMQSLCKQVAGLVLAGNHVHVGNIMHISPVYTI